MGTTNDAVEFRAPWGLALRLISVLAVAILLGVTGILWTNDGIPASARWSVSLGAPILMIGCALFTVRGYALEGSTLWVQRLFWRTRISLDGLTEAAVDPNALKASIRIAGNGGLFSFSGLFWNKSLGRFRAYVTDLNRAVTLRMAGRAIVISPDSPENFVATLKARRLLPA